MLRLVAAMLLLTALSANAEPEACPESPMHRVPNAELAGTDFSQNAALRLSQTGIFANLQSLTAAPGLLPYSVNAPLWSDGALKRRWIYLPGDGRSSDPSRDRIVRQSDGSWRFPVGSIFVKHFDLNVAPANSPPTLRRLETRILVVTASRQIQGFTYRWNEAQTDADLLSFGVSEDVHLQSQNSLQTWDFPSRVDCVACHSDQAHQILGVKTTQINRDCYNSETHQVENQLLYWNSRDMFFPAFEADEIATALKLNSISDRNSTLADRARSYLDANCSHCHQRGGVGAYFDARFETPLADQNLIGGTVASHLGIRNANVITPGDVERSILFQRLISLEPAVKMPQIAHRKIDHEAISLFREWINSLSN